MKIHFHYSFLNQTKRVPSSTFSNILDNKLYKHNTKFTLKMKYSYSENTVNTLNFIDCFFSWSRHKCFCMYDNLDL